MSVKITIEDNEKTYLFSDLKIGDFFLLGKELFIKCIRLPYDVNAISISSGNYRLVLNEDNIIPVDVNIICKRKNNDS